MANPYTLNQYPWWKYLLIGLVILWGLIFALPNLFGEDPAVQISGARANVAIESTARPGPLSLGKGFDHGTI